MASEIKLTIIVENDNLHDWKTAQGHIFSFEILVYDGKTKEELFVRLPLVIVNNFDGHITFLRIWPKDQLLIDCRIVRSLFGRPIERFHANPNRIVHSAMSDDCDIELSNVFWDGEGGCLKLYDRLLLCRISNCVQ